MSPPYFFKELVLLYICFLYRHFSKKFLFCLFCCIFVEIKIDMKDTDKKISLNNEDAMYIGRTLGYVDKVAKMKARRFYSYIKGEIKNWHYDDTVHYGDLTQKVIPVLIYLQKNDYFIPTV